MQHLNLRKLGQAIRHLDSTQADLTVYPDGCPEPWRGWIVEAHTAMCQCILAYRDVTQQPYSREEQPGV